MESFFGTLKTELVHHCKYRNRQETITGTSEDIELFHNRPRRHASLGNISAAAFWKKFIRQQGAA